MPREIILKILLNIKDSKSILAFSITCKRNYNTYLSFENFIWYKLCPPILTDYNLNLLKNDTHFKINYLDWYKNCEYNPHYKNSIRIANVVNQLIKGLWNILLD